MGSFDPIQNLKKRPHQNHKLIDGALLGYPNQFYKIEEVSGNSDRLLLIKEIPSFQAPAHTKTVQNVLNSISIVTGYPSSALHLGQNLISDLSIDSKKRRKIAIMILERLSQNLSNTDNHASDLLQKLISASLISDLCQILEAEFETENREGNLPNPSKKDSLPTSESSFSTPQNENEVVALLLKIAEEKTGYRQDQLSLDANLEFDLGIDTIKQAQIAGQMRKHYPVSFPTGLRIKDFPTLRHWVKFVMQVALQKDHSVYHIYKTERLETTQNEISLDPNSEEDTFSPKHILIVSKNVQIASDLKNTIGQNQLITVAHDSKVFIKDLPDTIDTVIHFGAIESEPNSFNSEIQILLDHLRLAQNLGNNLRKWITIRGDSTTELPVDGAISGFLKTLAQEKQVNIKLISMNRSEYKSHSKPFLDRIIKSIKQILLRSNLPHQELIFDSDKVYTQKLTHLPIGLNQAPSFELKPDSTVIIAGGSGGIGLEISKDLAKKHKLTLILLGRSKEKDLKEYQTRELNLIRDLGAKMIYESCDITNSSAVESLAQRLQTSFQKITGIIHAAGVLEDMNMDNKTEDSFKRVYSTKVQGAENLIRLGQSLQIDFFCVFSSISGKFGNIGQCDYSAANSALDSRIRIFRRESPSIRSFSIAWGPWDRIGMTAGPGIAELIQSSGYGLISAQEGVSSFYNELCLGGNTPEITFLSQKYSKKQIEPSIPENKFYFIDSYTEFHLGSFLLAKRTLSIQKDSFLKDHVILGIPILPATFGIEIMSQAALALFPSYHLMELQNIIISQAVRVPEDGGCHLQILAQGSYPGVPNQRSVFTKIYSQSGLAYEATIILISNESIQESTETDLQAVVSLEDSFIGTDKIYGNLSDQIPLGESFHVLDRYHYSGNSVSYGQAKLPSSYIPGLVSDPYLREAAFHTSALMRMKSHQEVLIPRSIGKIQYFSTSACNASQEIKPIIKSIFKSDCLFDLYMINAHGKVCTKISDFRTLNIQDIKSELHQNGF